MDRNFLKLMMEKTNFPETAKQDLSHHLEELAQKGLEEDLDGAVAFYYENHFDCALTEELLKSLSQQSGISHYTLWMLLLIEAAAPMERVFAEKHIPQKLFWETFSDLRCKALECYENYGVWGTFVAFWYPIFYSQDIVKLGRMEYENAVYRREEPYEKNGILLQKGDPVKHIHIPSSGEPFSREARLASYKKAYEFFREELQGRPLACLCHSWLLDPAIPHILPESSNIVSFQKDFHIISTEESAEFHDCWRVFGAASQRPLEQLPEDTSMRRAFKKYLLSGGKTSEGLGVLLFDGEKIIR